MNYIKGFKESYVDDDYITENDINNIWNIHITPIKTTIHKSDEESLSFELEMSNGDKISVDSFLHTGPPGMSKDYLHMKLNGLTILNLDKEETAGIDETVYEYAFNKYRELILPKKVN